MLNIIFYQSLKTATAITYFTFRIYLNFLKKPPRISRIVQQVKAVGLESVSIILLGAYFISMVFTLQVVKELLYFNASSIVGGTLVTIYIRELSPVITAIIFTGRIGSAFTAEIAVMKITEQLDALYMLNIDPINYLVLPRLLACCIVLPPLNILSFLISIGNSFLVSTLFYQIPVIVFLKSAYLSVFVMEFIKSIIKSIVFALIISITSCYCGFNTTNNTRGVGISITAAVVVILMLIFIADFALSYILLQNSQSIIN